MWYSPADVPLDESHDDGPSGEFNVQEMWPDLDPTTPGFQLTYSYSNLLDGGLRGGLSAEDLIAATEEALGLWASVAPLHFQEVVDSGPLPPSDEEDYPAADHPLIRIGYHIIDGDFGVLAHAYYPVRTDGLAGDVHFDNGDRWGTAPSAAAIDILEVMLHELGHSLGLGHETLNTAIMNPFYGEHFSGLGTGFLFDDDIAGIQEIYGVGVGSVTPLKPLIVDILADEDDGNHNEGDLSLREAIKLSQMGGGKQAISFAETLAGGTIVLDAARKSLVIDGPMTIEGLGASQLTIRATDPTPGTKNGDGFRIFQIDDDDPDAIANVRISGLTLTGGDVTTAGGAIFSAESLELEDVRVIGNHSAQQGGGVASTGPLSIILSTIDNNSAGNDGGGVHTLGGVTLDHTTVSGNTSAGDGGGVAADGEVTSVIVTSSTISGNTAVGRGGGLQVNDLNPAQVRITHSTVTKNQVTGSGGGVYLFNGVLVLEHSIIAKNVATVAAPDIDNLNLFAVPAVLAKYSFVGNDAGSSITELEPNQIGDATLPIDPMLGNLADNGGPTLTHLPLLGSPVINAGKVDVLLPPDSDQRGFGFDRIVSGVIDIGAIESNGFALTFTVDTLVDENDGDYTEGDLSLREAIALSNAQPGADLINFAAALSGGTINLNAALGQMVISDPMTIDAGDLIGPLTVNAATADPTPSLKNGDGIRAIRVDNSNAALQINVVIEGIAFVGGDVNGDGGALYSAENLTLKFVSLMESSATGNGGGLYHRDGSLAIENSTLANNRAGGDGGGLWNNTNLDAPVTGSIVSTTIAGNFAGDEGGGIFNFDGLLTIQHATIAGNLALKGGGVVSFGDPSTKTSVSYSIIAGNTGLDVERSRNTAYNSFDSQGYNVIGVGNALAKFNNHDQIEVLDPKLGPLTNNGGKTLTRAPREGSPAIDAGDPSLAPAEAPEFDQRGETFPRFQDGDANGSATIDIGALEAAPPRPNADFDRDTDVDGFDFLAWQLGLGKTADATPADGDSDRDGDVDAVDLANWKEMFGSVGPAEVTSHSATPSPAGNSVAFAFDASATSTGVEFRSETLGALLANPRVALALPSVLGLGSLDVRPWQPASSSKTLAREARGRELFGSRIAPSVTGRPAFAATGRAVGHALQGAAVQASAQSLDAAFDRLGGLGLSDLLDDEDPHFA